MLLGLDGHLKLADMSSAIRMSSNASGTPPPAQTFDLSGTPEFMAPEVILCKGTDERCAMQGWLERCQDRFKRKGRV